MRISRQLFLMVLGTSLMTVAVAMVMLALSIAQSLERQHRLDRELLRHTLSSQYNQYGNDLLDAIKEAVVNPMFLHDNFQVQKILASFVGRGGITNVYVFDEKWRVLIDDTEEYRSRGKHITDLFDTSVESMKKSMNDGASAIFVKEMIIDDQYRLGGIALVLDRSPMLASLDKLSQNMLAIQEEARGDQLRMLCIILPVILLFSVGVSVFVAQYFARPIKHVSREVKELELGNYDISLPDYRRDEVGDLARSMKKLAETLRNNEAFKSELISSVSHELRTPLTSVLGFAKLISRDMRSAFPSEALTDEKQINKAKRIESNLNIITLESQRLTRLISSVLDLSKIEAGTIEWEFRPGSITDALVAASKSMEGVFAYLKEVELTMDIPADLPEVLMDRDRIEQVVVNLLSNAAKFTEKGTVHLSARLLDGNTVQVNVTDTGIGIPEHMYDRIFERFRQVADEGRMKHNGTGLGLAICKEIVDAHCGRIYTMQCTDRGSRFTFELPVNGPGLG